MDGKFAVGLITANHFGVLNRVAGLYSKRGYNIDSLAVGETDNPAYSRMTIVSTGDDYMREQVVRQLKKLHDVKSVMLLEEGAAVGVEHLLIKLRAQGQGKALLSALINAFGGKTMDFGEDFVTADVTGSPQRIDAFIAEGKRFGILEVCRSGLIAMATGGRAALAAPTDSEENEEKGA